MSPTEETLRAALRQGEGAGIDPELVIVRVARLRREQRKRWRAAGAGLAAAAVVAGLGVGIANMNGSEQAGGSSSQADGAAGGVAGAERRAGLPAASRPSGFTVPRRTGAQATSGNPGAPGAAVGWANCPARLPTLPAPANVTSRPLFDEQPVAITICSAPSGTPGSPTRYASRVTGAAARSLAAALEGGATTPSVMNCMLPRTVPAAVLLAVDAQGRPLHPVVVTPRCSDALATNGHAVRYIRLDQSALGPIERALRARPEPPRGFETPQVGRTAAP